MPITLTDGVVIGAVTSLMVGSYGWTYKVSRDLRGERREERAEYKETCKEIFAQLRDIQGKLNRLMGKMELDTRNDEG